MPQVRAPVSLMGQRNASKPPPQQGVADEEGYTCTTRTLVWEPPTEQAPANKAKASKVSKVKTNAHAKKRKKTNDGAASSLGDSAAATPVEGTRTSKTSQKSSKREGEGKEGGEACVYDQDEMVMARQMEKEERQESRVSYVCMCVYTKTHLSVCVCVCV
jgi:hypothetical protein